VYLTDGARIGGGGGEGAIREGWRLERRGGRIHRRWQGNPRWVALCTPLLSRFLLGILGGVSTYSLGLSLQTEASYKQWASCYKQRVEANSVQLPGYLLEALAAAATVRSSNNLHIQSTT
jgi:hypothetical protein